MTPDEAVEKIVRIVDHQTTPEQPDTVPKHTITMFAEAGEDVFKAIRDDMADLRDEFDHWELHDEK